MRIISGEFRHRKLHTPRDATITRPIPDRVKESLFSLLRGWTEGASVLDVFAGTGAIGLEAVSRGASRCVFIERDKRIVELLRRNVGELGCDERCEVVMGDALGASLLSRCPRPVDLVFFDPPYPLIREPGDWARVKLQFGRVVALLSDHGYATLRTPWPFRHPVVGATPGIAAEEAVVVEEEAEIEEGGGRGERSKRKGSGKPDRRERSRGEWRDESKGGKRRGGRDEDDGEVDRIWEGDDLDELMANDFEGADEIEEPPVRDADADDALLDEETDSGGVRTEMVDLSILGAIGPETHIYGNTAIHLYMRDKAATPAP